MGLAINYLGLYLDYVWFLFGDVLLNVVISSYIEKENQENCRQL